ncbi:MAG: PAS domain S-box protein [Cyanobacteriota bacterium]|jgi:PAS domain S-box-containing protein
MPRTPLAQLLLVDDKPENLRLLEDVLAPAGYECQSATSGEAALAAIADDQYVLVILDLMMPGMDGLETAQRIRQTKGGSALPIVFLTAHQPTDEAIFAGYELGACDYLIKPIHPRILLSKVNVFVQLEQQKQQLVHQFTECEWVRDQLNHFTHNLEQIVQEKTQALESQNQRLEEQIQRQQHLEQVLASISDAVFMTDREGNFTFVCPNIDHIFGYTQAEIQNLKNIEALLGDLELYLSDLNGYPEIINRERRIEDRCGQRHDLLINIKKVAIGPSRYLYTCRDITERKKIEEDLRQSRNQLDNILSHTRNALIVLNQAGLIQYVNASAVELFGRPEGDLIGSDWGYPLTTDGVEIEILSPQQALKVAKLTLGEIIWEGQPAYLVSLQDITEQKALAESLEEKEQKYYHLLGNIQSGVVVHGPDTRVTYANPAALEFLGLGERDMLGKAESDPAWRFYFGDGRPISNPDFPVNQVLQTRQPLRNLEMGVYRPDLDAVLWAWINAYPELDEAGDLQQVIVTFIDITERKEAEFQLQNLNDQLETLIRSRTQELEAANAHLLREMIEREQVDLALKNQELKYRALVEDAGDAIILMDMSQTILEVNHQAISLTGYAQDGWLHLSQLGFIAPNRRQEAQDFWRELLRKKNLVWSNSEILTQTGESIGSDITASLIEYGDQRVVQWIIRDMRERQQAEIKLQQALDKEREWSQLKSQFVNIVSHEFRTPLTSILGFAELLLRYQQRLTPEKQQRYIQNIQTSGLRLKELIEDVLSLSRAESGRLDFQPAPTLVAEFCQELLEELRYGQGQHHDLRWQEEGVCLGLALLDARLLRHVLGNLLSNAIKYSPAGSVVTLSLTWAPEQVIFTVQDQGIGVPEADQAALFESFRRASNVGNIEGTGLGLSIVKRYVELQGGEIRFESQVDVGSAFTVILPLVWAEDGSNPGAEEPDLGIVD